MVRAAPTRSPPRRARRPPPGAPSPSAGAATSPLAGFDRTYDTLGHLTSTTARGGSFPAGASWAWGGQGRLYGVTTRGPLGTAARYGYIGGAGPQPPSGTPDARWQLGTLVWGGAPGADPVATATSAPPTTWGAFAFGWRGHQGDPRDGAKIGRQVQPTDVGLFAGLGWSWDYDGGVRLHRAQSGRGDLLGHLTPVTDDVERFTYDYGPGDELERIVLAARGQQQDVVTGSYGRIASRGGLSFSYDPAGRRAEDDRFVYRWNWRGELSEVDRQGYLARRRRPPALPLALRAVARGCHGQRDTPLHREARLRLGG